MRSYQVTHYRRLLLSTALFVSVLALPLASPHAGVVFDGVAAGDVTSNDAILWTRADNSNSVTPLNAQISTDPTFATGVQSISTTTVAGADYTTKVDATGLLANQKYYYRFQATDGSGATSSVGSLLTAPAANQSAAVRFGFSGDADGRFRPYTSVNGFGTAANPGSQNLNYFVFLGDTMYETASTGSPVVTSLTSSSNTATVNQGLTDYQRKYRENVLGVTSGGAPSSSGQQGLQAMLGATGSYTLLDNHELGNQSLQSGGAPLAAAARALAGQNFDVNTSGAYDNQTPAFKALQQAYLDYHPTKANLVSGTSTGPTVNAPGDARGNGTPQLYFAQQWGKNSVYVQVDDRTYRDARLGKTSSTDDTGARGKNTQRTMLGSTQLAWLKQTLLDAQAAGTPWKFVAISSPIDMTGPAQDGKSWYGGYAAERNDLLKFIADNHINNVVFLSTDDHLTRETQLQYLTDFNDPNSVATVPGAFLVVTGPIGAGGPDQITDHSFSNIQSLANNTNAGLSGMNEPLIGLCGMQGVKNVHRAGDLSGGCSSVDFYSPDTFNYTTLDVSADGSVLTVDTWGIPSYAANTFPSTGATVQEIMGFQVQAPEPGSIVMLMTGLLGLAAAARRRT